MRKHIIFYFAFILLIIQTYWCKAQQEFGQIVINAGVGFSPEFDGYIPTLLEPGLMFPVTAYDNAPYTSAQCPPWYNTSSIIPNLGATVDFGLLKWFSMGIAFSYQNEFVNWTPVDNTFPLMPSPFPYADKVTRINLAGRLLFHVINHKHLECYIGFRVGASFWHDITYPVNSVYPIGTVFIPPIFIGQPSLVVPSFQVVSGFRIFPGKRIGFNFEYGLGSPYLVEGGFSLKINNYKMGEKSKPFEKTVTTGNKN